MVFNYSLQMVIWSLETDAGARVLKKAGTLAKAGRSFIRMFAHLLVTAEVRNNITALLRLFLACGNLVHFLNLQYVFATQKME